MKIETGVVTLADGTKVPKRCVDALNELEKMWPGASLEKARPAIVRAVLEAYPDPRDVMNVYPPNYSELPEGNAFLKGTVEWYNRPYHAVQFIDASGRAWVYIWRDTWQRVSKTVGGRFEEN